MIFSARSAKELRTPARDAGRLARGVPFVVFIESDAGRWAEADAKSEAHAKRIANEWVDQHKARGCSIWRVREGSGKLAKRPVEMVFAPIEESNYED